MINYTLIFKNDDIIIQRDESDGVVWAESTDSYSDLYVEEVKRVLTANVPGLFEKYNWRRSYYMSHACRGVLKN
jgi:hypothetical protein